MGVLPFRPAVPESECVTIRQKYSFDMTQPDPRGFVLIDACVPAALAIEFMNMVALYAGND